MSKRAVLGSGDNVLSWSDEEFDPLHSAYIAAQNLSSVFAEAVSVLPELEEYYDVVAAADDEYIPQGPPMSPITGSCFTSWAFFDVRFGPDRETIGSCLMDVGEQLGVPAELAQAIECMRDSRMGVYEHAGARGKHILLRELHCRESSPCHYPTGYSGEAGQLWLARMLPPLSSRFDYHVIFTTPYVLLGQSEADWVAFFKRSLLDARGADFHEALADFMKHGPTPNYWNEFILQAYVNHQHDAIFLAGLPDVAGSRPHAS